MADDTQQQPVTNRLDAAEPPAMMLELAQELLETGRELSNLKPQHDIQSSLKGLGAVMRELGDAQEPLAPSDLAKRTCVSDARIANILRVLQERGLVQRKQSTSDKRRAEISLTAKGAEECAKGKNDLERAVANFLAAMGEEDARLLIYSLGRAADTISDLRDRGFKPRPPMEVEFEESEA